MKKTILHTLSLTLAFVTGSFGDPEALSMGGGDIRRDDPKIEEALRTIPWSAGPNVDAFNEALHAEEVARDLEAAAGKYGAIVEKHRARDNDHMAGVAALSLFRLAEIRRKQDRSEEARKHYEEVIAEFEDWEPMVSLSRQQLGLDPSEFFPRVTEIEDDRPLTEKVERTTWKVRTRVCEDKFVLVTFRVEPDEKDAYEGMPKKQEIQTLHYLPSGPLTGFISSTCVLGKEIRKGKILGLPIYETHATRVTGFGHSYDVPGGLGRTVATSIVDSDWIGMRSSNFDAKVVLQFNDEMDDKSKGLSVGFELETISGKEAHELARKRFVDLPELGLHAWSLTLPTTPAKLKEAHRSE